MMGPTLLYLMFASTRLRPLADDYCAAFQAKGGVIQAVLYWWSTSSTELFGTFFVTLIAGLPIVFLPPNLASAIPFLVVVLSVSLVLWLIAQRMNLVNRGLKNTGIYVASTLLVFFGAAFGWIGFWWISAYGDAEFELGLAVSATMWPTTTLLYILTTMIAIAWLTLALTSQGRRWALVGFFLGAFIGLSGLLVGVSSIATICAWLILITTFRLRNGITSHGTLRAGLATLLGLVLGIAISLLSPGSEKRSESTLQEFSPPVALNRVFPESIVRLVDSYTSLGTIVVFTFFVGLGWVIFLLSGRQKYMLKFSVLVIPLLFNIVATSIATLIDGVVYYAVWHQVLPYSSLYVLVALAGLVLGRTLSIRGEEVQALIAIAFVISGMALVTSINSFAGTAAERQSLWSVAPAPLGGISDIEEDEFQVCWKGLGKVGKRSL